MLILALCFESSFPSQVMQNVMKGFQEFCGLPSCHGAIDATHFVIAKPNKSFLGDYYYHKSIKYNVVCQVIVDD